MADMVWKSSGGQGTAEVVVAGVKYTFASGVPTDVPIEHYAAVQTALNALADTTSAAAGDPEV